MVTPFEFTAMIDVPVTVKALICPATGDGRSEPYIPEHPEDIVIRFNPRQAQAELDRAAQRRWLAEYVMEKWEDKQWDEGPVSDDHLLGGLRPVTVRPNIPVIEEGGRNDRRNDMGD